MDNDDQRDYVEEDYWRNYCPVCDRTRCPIDHSNDE